DGKRLLSVMALGVKQGDEITVIAEGVDEAEAIHAIRKLFYDNFGE
ncbi:MAG: HPr family phosphocarrier protein, partial [Epulopiscium sp.]|nr:HPr family phosphocarrier protein [Candidatus Epulonipiscium sp.]